MKERDVLFTVYTTENNGIEIKLGQLDIDGITLLGALELVKNDIIQNMSHNAVKPQEEAPVMKKPKYDA
jgi:DNA polymerase III epsilon subunit-like protein